MSLVTSQGLKARNDVDAAVGRVRNDLLDLIAQNDLSLSDAFVRFPSESEQTVREAVWRLLNERKVEVGPGTRLHFLQA